MSLYKLRRKLKGTKGFTLIELIAVIIILAVLGLVSFPIFVNLGGDADSSAEDGVVGGVRAGLTTYFIDAARGNRSFYPSVLDSATSGAACSTGNVCFADILSQGGIISEWTKASATTYTGPNNLTYTYTSATGAFV